MRGHCLAAAAGLVFIGFALSFTLPQMADGPEILVQADASPLPGHASTTAIVPNPPKVVAPPEALANQEVSVPPEAEQVALAPAAVVEEEPAADPEPVAIADLPVAPAEEPPAVEEEVPKTGEDLPATETQIDYFPLFRQAYVDLMSAGVETKSRTLYRVFEIESADGVFKVCFSRYGPWNGTGKPNTRDLRINLYVGIATPGGNTYDKFPHVSFPYDLTELPLIDVIQENGRTIFMAQHSYLEYHAAPDELRQVAIPETHIRRQGVHNTTGKPMTGEIAAKVNGHYIVFSRIEQDALIGLRGIFTVNLANNQQTFYWFNGPGGGALKKQSLEEDTLRFVLTYNPTRDVEITFAPGKGFNEAAYVELAQDE